MYSTVIKNLNLHSPNATLCTHSGYQIVLISCRNPFIVKTWQSITRTTTVGMCTTNFNCIKISKTISIYKAHSQSGRALNKMSFEVVLSVEGSVAGGAGEGFLPGVTPHVDLQLTLGRRHVTAHGAREPRVGRRTGRRGVRRAPRILLYGEREQNQA